MFTGIIQDIGQVASIEAHGQDLRMAIAVTSLSLGNQAIGDSIAVSGVCPPYAALLSKGLWRICRARPWM